jgi:hypothetical protein
VNLVGGSIIAEVELPAAAAAQLQQEFQQGKVTALGGLTLVSMATMEEAFTATVGVRLKGNLDSLDEKQIVREISSVTRTATSQISVSLSTISSVGAGMVNVTITLPSAAASALVAHIVSGELTSLDSEAIAGIEFQAKVPGGGTVAAGTATNAGATIATASGTTTAGGGTTFGGATTAAASTTAGKLRPWLDCFVVLVVLVEHVVECVHFISVVILGQGKLFDVVTSAYFWL